MPTAGRRSRKRAVTRKSGRRKEQKRGERMGKREMGGGKLESRRTSEGEVAIVDEEGGTDRAGKFGAPREEVKTRVRL